MDELEMRKRELARREKIAARRLYGWYLFDLVAAHGALMAATKNPASLPYFFAAVACVALLRLALE